MRFIGNLIWFVFGGLILGLSWAAIGLVWCITIVGIPVGVQCFKLAKIAFFPFGKDIKYGGGVVSVLWRHCAGNRIAYPWRNLLRNHSGDSVWIAVFQVGENCPYAVWSKDCRLNNT